MLKGWIGRLFPYLLVALIAGAAGGALGAVTLNDRGIQQRPVEYQRREEGQRPERIVYPEGENPGIVRAVAEKNIQAVVSIITVEIRRDEMFNPTEERGVGSGVIVEPNGYILTNDHVVGKNAREINVLFENGQQMIGMPEPQLVRYIADAQLGQGQQLAGTVQTVFFQLLGDRKAGLLFA